MVKYLFQYAKKEGWLEVEHEDGLNQVTCQFEIAKEEEWLEVEREVDFHLLTWLEIEHETQFGDLKMVT